MSLRKSAQAWAHHEWDKIKDFKPGTSRSRSTSLNGKAEPPLDPEKVNERLEEEFGELGGINNNSKKTENDSIEEKLARMTNMYESVGAKFNDRQQELRVLRNDKAERDASLRSQQKELLKLRPENQQLETFNAQIYGSREELRAQYEGQVLELTKTNSETLEKNKKEYEAKLKGYQDEMEKKNRKIEELQSEKNDLKKEVLDLNIQREQESLSNSGFLDKEPAVVSSEKCQNCEDLQKQLEASNKTIGLLEPMAQQLYYLRHRFLDSKNRLYAEASTKLLGNRAAHDGNIVVDVSLFKTGKHFNIEDHAFIFDRMYDYPIADFLHEDFDFETFKNMPTVCKIFGYRATMAHQNSFCHESLTKYHDKQYNFLERQFKVYWERRHDPAELAALENMAEIREIEAAMKPLMEAVTKKASERLRPKGKPKGKSNRRH